MAKRINKIQEFLDEKDIDALLIKSKTVKKWMNTMTGSGCQVLITKEHGYLIVDGRYITEAKEKEAVYCADVPVCGAGIGNYRRHQLCLFCD